MVKGYRTCGLILSTCYKPRHVLMNSLKKKLYMLWFVLLLSIAVLHYYWLYRWTTNKTLGEVLFV